LFGVREQMGDLMRRRLSAVVAAGVLISAWGVAPADATPDEASAPPPAAGSDVYDVYQGQVDLDALAKMRAAGVDPHDLTVTSPSGDQVEVEVVLSGEQADQLAEEGVALEPKLVDGQTVAELSTLQAEAGFEVFRPYSGPGGLKEEFEQIAADNPDIVKLVTIGQTQQGQDIIALKITRKANREKDGAKPATLFSAAQHAREWITPEMLRRLAHHVVDGYDTDRSIRRLVNSTEMWFVPVANPDGYDWSFQPGQRMWRKNLRDNNGDGVTQVGDGVDPNRNFSTKWGYDNEGSSPNPASDTYRGPSPGSEPETQALDGLMARIGFEFQINYHSAAELLLYGTGWQVATPTPDDAVYETMAGDDAEPAVPGYDPDISAELYTTNGETTEHAHTVYSTLAFTPEMSTCQTVSAAHPDDEWRPQDCGSVFHFPDDEELVQEEFEKNIPFALATARSASDPDNPVSVVGRTAPDFVTDPFTVSYGDPQTVSVWGRRDHSARWMNFSVNGGPVRRVAVAEWEGGERYGDETDVYYAEYRSTVTGAAPGDSVEVWFTGIKGLQGNVDSEHFTYEVASDTDAQALIIANEDYTGVNPTYPAGTTAPKHADEYAAALGANGITHATWDMDAQGVPHPLGVLSHFDAVVWEQGDNRLTQDPEDEFTQHFLPGAVPNDDLAVAEEEQYLTLAVRDFLNEGGKAVLAGETAQYYGNLGTTIGGIYYGLDGAPEEDCVITTDFFSDCLIVADDFAQYYLGAFARAGLPGATAVEGTGALEGVSAEFGGPAVADNPLDEAGAFTLTSDVLPPDQFPLFAGAKAADYLPPGTNPFGPREGERYAAVLHQDASYASLGRTIDLSGVAAADAPALEFALSWSTEFGYDNVIVEAAPSGTDDWTTLPDLNGNTQDEPPTECEGGFYADLHPFLLHYLTVANPCATTGTSGEWHSFTGESGAWEDVKVDLTGYAGGSVDVRISYVTDPFTGGVGAFVDDTRVTTTAGTLEADGFEGETSVWSVLGPPEGSPEGSAAFQITTVLIDVSAAVATEDTVLFGFGIEQLATAEEQAAVLGAALAHVLG
jgi:Zinc carboxypeptidase/Immune inhibitor A-like, MAM domain